MVCAENLLKVHGIPLCPLPKCVHMHILREPGLVTPANSNFVYLPNPKPIVRGIRPVSCQKDYCCMYTILNGLFVTLLCALKKTKQVSGGGFLVCFFFFPLMGVLGVGEKEKKKRNHHYTCGAPRHTDFLVPVLREAGTKK